MKLLNVFIIGSMALAICSCENSADTKRVNYKNVQRVDSIASPSEPVHHSEVSLDFYKEKRDSGIEFYAVGNEPFWALDMNPSEGFKFSTPSFQYNCPPVDPVIAQDAPLKRYRAVTESGEIIIRVSKTGCTDNMSGQEFSHKVSVSFKRSIDSTFTEFTGCGRFVPDLSLHDIWGLIEYKGVKYPNNDLPGGAQMELFPVDERVIISDGCNSFSGSFHSAGKTIYFGNLAGTLKACPEMKDNKEFISELGRNEFTYQRSNRQLVLTKDSTVIFKWRKID